MTDLISIVIPVYNGENSLKELYQALKIALAEEKINFEIIFIDDYSSDQSYQKILKLHKKDPKVEGIRLQKNFGQQNAIFAGLHYCQGDYIITMDDDLQHKPQDIIRLYQKIKKGFDVVYAIPKKRKYKFHRKLGSKLTNKLFNLITPKTDQIRVSSFRIFNKKTLLEILKTKKSFIYLSAVILKSEAKIANIYSEVEARKYGNSNYNFFKLIKLFLKLYIYYSEIPILKYFRSTKKAYKIAETTFGFSDNIVEN